MTCFKLLLVAIVLLQLAVGPCVYAYKGNTAERVGQVLGSNTVPPSGGSEDVVKESDIVGPKEAIEHIQAQWNTFWDSVKTKLSSSKKSEIEAEAQKEVTKKPAAESKPTDQTEVSREEKPVSSSSGGTTTTLIETGDGVKTTTVEIELSGKSYIRPVTATSCPRICRFYPVDLTCAGLATAFCASMPSPAGVISTVHEPYGPTGNFRLYSKMKFRLTCAGGKPTGATIVNQSSKTGMEGPLQAPDGSFVNTHARVSRGVAHIGYQFTGRPPIALEPGFLAIRLRTCPYIWHYPYFKITSCSDDGSWSGTYTFGHSNFPTHRLWRDGTLKETVAQNHIKALWISSSADRTLVRGVWPNT